MKSPFLNPPMALLSPGLQSPTKTFKMPLLMTVVLSLKLNLANAVVSLRNNLLAAEADRFIRHQMESGHSLSKARTAWIWISPPPFSL